MTGQARNYILFRMLPRTPASNAWTRFFTPAGTLAIFLLMVIGIELVQNLRLYDATYDPWELPAYVSLLLPAFLIDVLTRRAG